MSLPLNLFLKASWLCSNSVRGVAQRGCTSTGALNSIEGSVVIVTVATAKAIEQVVPRRRRRGSKKQVIQKRRVNYETGSDVGLVISRRQAGGGSFIIELKTKTKVMQSTYI